MSTYAKIIGFVKERNGRSIAPCWVSECKAERLGLLDPHLNRDGSERKRQKNQLLTNEARARIYNAFDALGVPNGRRAL